MSWLRPSAAEARLIPGGRFNGPTAYIIAIMMFVMVIVAAAGLVLSNSAAIVARGVANRYSVQIANGAGQSDSAAKIVARLPGVVRARPVGEAAMRDTLARWLGPSADAAALPLPALIEIDLAPGASPDAVGAAVARALPDARFVADKSTLQPILGALKALTWLAFGLVVLIALATVAAVVLAARGALDTHRGTIEVMHGIGATDVQISGLFQRKIALDALAGGFAGGLAAGLVLLLVLGGGAGLVRDLTGGSALGLGNILVLASLPLIGAALATLVARTAVLGALRRAP